MNYLFYFYLKQTTLRTLVLRSLAFAAAIGLSYTAGAQVITTIAGDGTPGYTTDIPPIPGLTGRVNNPSAVAVNAAGDVFIADFDNHRIRKIDRITGNITTIAGTGTPAFWGDGSAATAAALNRPYGMDFDAAGNLYFSDFGNNVIRKITPAGIISTIAGLPGTLAAYTGDGGPATAAGLGNPMGLVIDAGGNVVIADQMNHAIRKISLSTGIISTIVGNGLIGISTAGDGGIASAAKLNYPHDLAKDAAGNIYICDYGNNRIRKITAATGIISTVAGLTWTVSSGSVYGYSGDGGPATAARLNNPEGLAVDAVGNIYISDFSNHAIRKVNTSGVINTITGNGTAAFSGDGGPAIAAQLAYPMDVAVRTDGDIIIADKDNQRIRQIAIGDGPYFIKGDTTDVVICPIEFSVLDSALAVDDIDVGQTLSWSPLLLPAHGTLSATYSTLSTGSTVTPSGMTYAPFLGYTGPDTFSVLVTDGTDYDTIVLAADVLGPLLAGTITGADSVCPGQTVTEVSSVAGGTWSSSDVAKATISSEGVVTGVTPGTATITYTYTHFCGTYYAYKTVTVIATVPCVNSVANVATESGMIEIVPNPGYGHFDIRLGNGSSTEQGHLQVADMTGRVLYEQDVTQGRSYPLDLSIPPGIYNVIVSAPGYKSVKKLVVQ